MDAIPQPWPLCAPFACSSVARALALFRTSVALLCTSLALLRTSLALLCTSQALLFLWLTPVTPCLNILQKRTNPLQTSASHHPMMMLTKPPSMRPKS
jgi:CHASE2 domain-containing sensor protein